jgi:ribosome-binding protein aMBF1 (putative translation factor)
MCALLGICQRTIRSKRTPDGGLRLRRKGFPQEIKTLGDLLRKQRSERGLKLKKLALLLGVTNNLVTAWEHGLAIPTAEQWKDLTRWLNLPSTLAEAEPNS